MKITALAVLLFVSTASCLDSSKDTGSGAQPPLVDLCDALVEAHETAVRRKIIAPVFLTRGNGKALTDLYNSAKTILPNPLYLAYPNKRLSDMMLLHLNARYTEENKPMLEILGNALRKHEIVAEKALSKTPKEARKSKNSFFDAGIVNIYNDHTKEVTQKMIDLALKECGDEGKLHDETPENWYSDLMGSKGSLALARPYSQTEGDLSTFLMNKYKMTVQIIKQIRQGESLEKINKKYQNDNNDDSSNDSDSSYNSNNDNDNDDNDDNDDDNDDDDNDDNDDESGENYFSGDEKFESVSEIIEQNTNSIKPLVFDEKKTEKNVEQPIIKKIANNNSVVWTDLKGKGFASSSDNSSSDNSSSDDSSSRQPSPIKIANNNNNRNNTNQEEPRFKEDRRSIVRFESVDRDFMEEAAFESNQYELFKKISNNIISDDNIPLRSGRSMFSFGNKSNKTDSIPKKVSISSDKPNRTDSIPKKVSFIKDKSNRTDSIPKKISISDDESNSIDNIPKKVSISNEKSNKTDSIPKKVSISDDKSNRSDSIPKKVSISSDKPKVTFDKFMKNLKKDLSIFDSEAKGSVRTQRCRYNNSIVPLDQILIEFFENLPEKATSIVTDRSTIVGNIKKLLKGEMDNLSEIIITALPKDITCITKKAIVEKLDDLFATKSAVPPIIDSFNNWIKEEHKKPQSQSSRRSKSTKK